MVKQTRFLFKNEDICDPKLLSSSARRDIGVVSVSLRFFFSLKYMLLFFLKIGVYFSWEYNLKAFP